MSYRKSTPNCDRSQNINTRLHTFSPTHTQYKQTLNINLSLSAILILKHPLKASEVYLPIEIITK
ncbi:MAG: hypothetical protein AAF378_13945 [Cyanobacteria bacterium P01_A01_bin.84]